MKKSEIRKDYLLDKYVIISAARGKRPQQVFDKEVRVQEASPFTPDKIEKNKILDTVGRGEERVIVIKNIFPALTPDNPKAYGLHEVIIETPQASVALGELPLTQIENVLKMYAKRTKALMKDPKIGYILCFKNEGAKSGASIRHAHSQVLAMELVPPDLSEEARRAADYQKARGSNFYLDLIKKEMKSPRRVFENNHFAAFTPFASAYHYELWIMAKRPVDNICQLKKEEIASLAKLLKKALAKLGKLGLSYNFFCHQSVSDRKQHFAIRIEPRDSVWGGIELGSGLAVNSVPPEAAAKFYRK